MTFMMAMKHVPNASDLWYQKVRAEFNVMDVDNNGFLSIADKAKMMKQFIERNHRVQHSQAEKRFKEAMDTYLWDIFETYPKVTYEKYVEGRLDMLEKHTRDEAACKRDRGSLYSIYFDFCDLNRDKKWDTEEACMYFNLMGKGDRPQAEMDCLFKAMDQDKDGMLNFDEFAHAAYSFQFDQQPGPFDLLMGPLPALKESKPKKK